MRNYATHTIKNFRNETVGMFLSGRSVFECISNNTDTRTNVRIRLIAMQILHCVIPCCAFSRERCVRRLSTFCSARLRKNYASDHHILYTTGCVIPNLEGAQSYRLSTVDTHTAALKPVMENN